MQKAITSSADTQGTDRISLPARSILQCTAIYGGKNTGEPTTPYVFSGLSKKAAKIVQENACFLAWVDSVGHSAVSSYFHIPCLTGKQQKHLF